MSSVHVKCARVNWTYKREAQITEKEFRSTFPTQNPLLVAVDKSILFPRCMPISSAVADFSHNLTLCEGVMSMQ